MLIQNAGFRGYVLCANADNESVYVKPIDTRDRFCTWVQISSGPAQIMYNVGKDQVMAYTGGNEGAVVMEDEKRTPSGQTPNTQLWSWGGEEAGEASRCSPTRTAARTSTPRPPTATTPAPTRSAPAAGATATSAN